MLLAPLLKEPPREPEPKLLLPRELEPKLLLLRELEPKLLLLRELEPKLLLLRELEPKLLFEEEERLGVKVLRGVVVPTEVRGFVAVA